MAATPQKQVWPSLRARDAKALIAFLVDAFGFEETVVYADGDVVHHAQLSWPEGGGIMLGSAGGDGSATSPGAFGAYVVTDQPERCTSGPEKPARRSPPNPTTPTTAPGTSRRRTRRGTTGRSAPTGASPQGITKRFLTVRRRDSPVGRTGPSGYYRVMNTRHTGHHKEPP